MSIKSMRKALLEMANAGLNEGRAKWVPESIADEDVADFMGAAADAKKSGKDTFTFGGKSYKVTMKKDTAKDIEEKKSEDEDDEDDYEDDEDEDDDDEDEDDDDKKESKK